MPSQSTNDRNETWSVELTRLAMSNDRHHSIALESLSACILYVLPMTTETVLITRQHTEPAQYSWQSAACY